MQGRDLTSLFAQIEQLIQLDISAQTNVPYSFRTAYGLTDPLLISGVTKQGGPLSPLKSTLTTSLGHHWLQDLCSRPGRGPCSLHFSLSSLFSSHSSRSITFSYYNGRGHGRFDYFCHFPSLPFLHTLVLAAERFQAAYGWLTSWPKSLLLLLNHP